MKDKEMTKAYPILRKKLKDLEHELEQSDRLPEDIEQRIDFLKNFLSAEVASHSSKSSPRFLRHLSKRVSRIESRFLNKTTSIDGTDIESRISVADSSCSGTDSYFNDDVDDDGGDQAVNSSPIPVPEIEEQVISPAIVEGKTAEETVRVLGDEKQRRSRNLKRDWARRSYNICLVMMCNGLFAMIGAGLMLTFCGCSNYYYYMKLHHYSPGFITPT